MRKSIISQKHNLKFHDLQELGEIEPEDYFNERLREINELSLQTTTFNRNNPVARFVIQDETIFIDEKEFFIFMICQPDVDEIDEKPSGLIFLGDLSFLQINEILFYCLDNEKLYMFEYMYHYNIWDYDNDKSIYFFRFDRDIRKSNPPVKEITHFHVYFSQPHFNSGFMTLKKVLDFIVTNWKNDCFHIKELTR